MSKGVDKTDKTTRRHFLKLAGIATAAFATHRTIVAASKPPNILMVVSDDQGWGDLPSNWDDTDVLMPVMDEVGRTGIRFTDFYVNPLCGPTRASLMTGQYSMENGMWRGPGSQEPGETNYRGIKSDVVMLPQLLQRADYATGAFGKWHLGYFDGSLPNDRGFDEFYGFLSGAHRYGLLENEAGYLHNTVEYCEESHATDYITDKAEAFIRDSVAGSKPFFCYVPYNAVHGPLWREAKQTVSAKQEWLDKAAARGIDYPRRDYVAILEHMDDCVGRLLDVIDEVGVAEDTLVMYFSDNGGITMDDPTKAAYPGNNGPFRGGKGQVYEGGVRVPCVMRWKGKFPQGTISNGVAMHADIFATCLEAAGLDVPTKNGSNPVHGKSLLPHIISSGTEKLPERIIFFELTGKLGCRNGKYKMVGQIESSRADWTETISQLHDTDLELYDLSNDIGETTDLRTVLPTVYTELKLEMIEFFKNIDGQSESLVETSAFTVPWWTG